METGTPGSANALVRINSVAAQTEKRMDIQAPLTAVYFHTLPALPAQPSAAAQEAATLHLPSLYSKETLPFLTLHLAGGLQSQPGLCLAAAAPATRPKSAGKHVCPHCGRDCMKPSVLEKHLRCHTGERPYPCTICGISFKTQSNLYKHKRTQAHARLSSESEQSSLGSLDSMSNSREICTSSLSLECSKESGGMEKEATLPAAESSFPDSTVKVYSVKMLGSVGEPSELSPEGHNTEANGSTKVTIKGEKQTMVNEKPALTASRHLPLQRQEATLFSKQWESSVSRGKSQSHESTDSGFSETSDLYPSPGSVLPDHNMDSHSKSTKDHVKETTGTHTCSEPGQGGQEPKDTVREQEQKTLEERISKLISENTAVVEDKQLENIRPRKTVLSKQGSIDLPMPYTYKDSFHFDMRISKTPNVGLQRRAGFYSSVPTQHSTTMEHAPLIRSNSLPFSVTLLQPETSCPTSSYQSDNVTLAQRGSSGQINPTGFTIKPVNQQSATHRPLVRQTAVDCNHAADGLINSSVEEVYAGSLSCDGDSIDICGEPNNRKLQRKKAQKFAYNKWYMYGGGTFKKLYNAEKGGDDVIKGRKCSRNPKHEVVQGLQKTLSAIQKETVTTGSTLDFTSSSATGCHPGCPPAKPSLVPAVEFNLKTSQLYTSCSSLKTPHRRNLSLSVLPLPLIGSLVSHKKDNVSGTEAGRLIHEKEHTDSNSQLCGSPIPSDRKKQKTDDKLMCPLEIETDPNTLTHPPPSVTGSALQQDTNLSYINLQKNEKHTPLKAALFPPCKISANTSSVSTLPSSFTPSFTKTSFLPKYQLKLPNAADPDSKFPMHDGNKPIVTDGCNVLSSSYIEQNSPSVTMSENRCPVTSPLMLSCDTKKTTEYSSKQGQLRLPCVATTLCQTETSRLNQNVTSSLAVVHRQFASTTKTTTCLQDYKAGLCSTSIQPTISAGGSASVQLPRPVTPVVVTLPATPTIIPANNQTSATTFSRGQPNPNPPLSHTQLLQASTQLSPVNRAYTGSKTPIVSCHIVPFDQMQPATQNVFHVHTADLQICLQIISDEQLALIEPQIERQAGSTLSSRCDTKAQSPITTESSNEGMDHQQPEHHKELDESESSPTLNMDGIKPLSAQFKKAMPNLHLTEHSDSTQVTGLGLAESSESQLPDALDSLQHPHKCGHVNTVTEAQRSTGDVMSTSASLRGVKQGRSQTSLREHALSLNYCAEEQHLSDKRVSQSRSVSQTLSGQLKPHVTFLSSSTVNQNSLRSDISSSKSQHKLKIQRALCNIGTIKAKSEASAHMGNMLKCDETHPPLQTGLSQASGAICADELSGSAVSFSIKTPRQLNPQTCIYCSNPVESTLSEALKPFRHANMGCDRLGLLEDSAPSQEMGECESQDVISSSHSEEKQPGPFTSTSSKIQADQTIPAVLSSIQSPAGLLVGASLAGCAAQKEPQTQGHEQIPKQSDEPGKTNHQCLKEQGGGGVAGENKDTGNKTDGKPGQWGKAESNCRYTCLQDMTKPEGEDRKVRVDSFKNSSLHEQHLSQTHSGMLEFPPPSLQQATSMSDNLHLPASNSQTGLSNSPCPPLEINNFYLSQQHWESSVNHNQQTHFLCESNSSQHIKAQAQLTETQNAFLQVESSPQQTQDHKQTSVTLLIQQGNVTVGNNITAVSCYTTQLTSGSHINALPDIKTSSSTHPGHMSYSTQVSRATAGLTVATQPSNHSALDNNTVLSSKPFTYPEPDDYQDTKYMTPSDYMSQSCNFRRPDITNKYQSFLFAGPLHGYQAAECMTSGVRPVQSCQDYTEDTSSSDDEGKLIIEL